MFNFIKGLGRKIRDFSVHIIEMMDVNAEFEDHKYGYKIPDVYTLINHFLWLYFYYNQYKIVSRFYETPVRHRLRLRRMPGGPARSCLAMAGGLKSLSLFEAKEYPVLHSINRANENGA